MTHLTLLLTLFDHMGPGWPYEGPGWPDGPMPGCQMARCQGASGQIQGASGQIQGAGGYMRVPEAI